MARRVRISTWYARTAGRVLRGSSPRTDAVGRTVRALAAAEALPGPTDYEAMGRRIGRAFVRRVGGRNLWVWYRITDEYVTLVTVTTEPPIPVDE